MLLLDHMGFSYRKEFAPSGSKFFPLRVAPILEAILGIVFKLFPVMRKNDSVLTTPVNYSRELLSWNGQEKPPLGLYVAETILGLKSEG